MEIVIYTPNLEVVIQDGIVFMNYIIEQVIDITAKIGI